MDEDTTVDQLVMPEKLKKFLSSLPLPEPTRVVTTDDGLCTIAEWQLGETYYEVEIDNNELSIMCQRGGVFFHWDIKEV
jgi:hypothetical protein